MLSMKNIKQKKSNFLTGSRLNKVFIVLKIKIKMTFKDRKQICILVEDENHFVQR